VDYDVGMFIDVTGSVLYVCAHARVCVSAYIYCGRCIKSAFTKEEENFKVL